LDTKGVDSQKVSVSAPNAPKLFFKNVSEWANFLFDFLGHNVKVHT
jgi:hypothetical protein